MHIIRRGTATGGTRRAVLVRAAVAAVAVAAGLSLAGCGSEAATVGGKLGVAPSSPGADGRRIDLVVTVRDRPGAAATTWTLTCNPNGGSHPDKEGACKALLAAGDDPWAPVPTGRACTAQAGDDRVATVTGLWYGVRVTADFDRTNSCQIARWDAVGPLFEKGAAASEAPGDGEESAAATGDVTGEVDGPDPAMVQGGSGSGEGDEAASSR